MSDKKKRGFGIFKILGVVVILLLVAIIALPFLIDANQFRPKLESEISGALGREVKIGNLKLSLLSGGVAADDISIADDPAFSRSPFVHARSLQVGVELKPLIFSRQIRITRVSLEQPEITLIRSDPGQWNFSSIGGKAEPQAGKRPAETGSDPASADLTVSLLTVTNGRVTLMRGGGHQKPRIYDKVEIKARNLSFSSVIPFTLSAGLPGGGGIRLDGQAGPLNRDDLSLTPVAANLEITHFDLVASGFIDPNSGLAGIIDLNSNLNSDGKLLRTKGRAKADKLQIVKGGVPAGQPISLDYGLTYNPRNQSGTLSETKVEFAKAVARLDGTYDMRGDSTVLKMRLRGKDVPAQDLQALLPAIGVTLPKGASLKGGTLDADLTAEGPVEKLTITGPIGIANTRLDGFDLAGKMATVASLAGIKSNTITEIEKFALDLRMVPDGIQASNLLLIVPALGQLTGNGTVGSNYALDFKMLAKLNTSRGLVGGLSRISGVKTADEVGIPFFIRGTTSDPKFVPDVKGAATGLLDSALSGKDAKSADRSQGESLGDTLRGLFKKKKP